MLFAASAGLVAPAIALTPRAANPVAVVMPPWAADDAAIRAVANAGGLMTATAHGGRIAVARFDSADFVTQLYRAGALFVLDATIVTSCLTLTRASL